MPGRDFSKLDDAQGVMGAACTKQGYLLKRGRRLASWKRRCFCLCASELFYYYTAEMSNPFQASPQLAEQQSSKQQGSSSSDLGTPPRSPSHTSEASKVTK